MQNITDNHKPQPNKKQKTLFEQEGNSVEMVISS